ncbi:MAG: DUF817 domain-containing protein [Cyanobacteria bacterium TGS_CYA1]|nr:DUF817 domain-containing protein [Cyanobacteria bacterium TGS_CYA1]
MIKLTKETEALRLAEATESVSGKTISAWKVIFRQLEYFTSAQALSCIFPVAIFLSLALTKVFAVPGLPRYDLLLLLCILVQFGMYTSKLETLDEVKVILVFHAIGLCLELFKTHLGSWSYPDFAYSKIGGVPLYSGFLYSSVASYMCQSWRRLNLKLVAYPKSIISFPFAVCIYANFFSEHFMPDLRFILIPLVFVIFWKSKVHYTVADHRRSMPLSISFCLIGLFVWFAENISTFLNAWQYPYQADKWCMVHSSKISSWFLLVIISFIVVAHLKHVKEKVVSKERTR